MSRCKRTQLFAYYLRHLTWLKTVEIASLLGRSPAATSMAHARIEERALREPPFAASLLAVEAEIRDEFQRSEPLRKVVRWVAGLG